MCAQLKIFRVLGCAVFMLFSGLAYANDTNANSTPEVDTVRFEISNSQNSNITHEVTLVSMDASEARKVVADIAKVSTADAAINPQHVTSVTVLGDGVKNTSELYQVLEPISNQKKILLQEYEIPVSARDELKYNIKQMEAFAVNSKYNKLALALVRTFLNGYSVYSSLVVTYHPTDFLSHLIIGGVSIATGSISGTVMYFNEVYQRWIITPMFFGKYFGNSNREVNIHFGSYKKSIKVGELAKSAEEYFKWFLVEVSFLSIFNALKGMAGLPLEVSSKLFLNITETSIKAVGSQASLEVSIAKFTSYFKEANPLEKSRVQFYSNLAVLGVSAVATKVAILDQIKPGASFYGFLTLGLVGAGAYILSSRLPSPASCASIITQ